MGEQPPAGIGVVLAEPVGLHPELAADDAMLHQVAPDLRRVMDHGDAERAQRLGRADPRAHQYARRFQRPGGDQHLARRLIFAAVGAAHAARLPALEDQPVDPLAGDDPQIGPPRRALEERSRRAVARPWLIVCGISPIAPAP